MTSAHRIRAVLGLARGIVEARVEDFGAHPDLLNTPSGVVGLRPGEITTHDPDLYLTKITSGSYRPGYTPRLGGRPARTARRGRPVATGQARAGHHRSPHPRRTAARTARQWLQRQVAHHDRRHTARPR